MRIEIRTLALVVLSAGLLLLPAVVDGLLSHLASGGSLDREPIPPTEILGLFEIVELLLVATYLSAIRKHPLRLGLALFVLAAASIGFFIGTFFHALRPSTFHSALTQPLEWISAIATLAAVAASATGNLLIRRPRLSYLPPAALLLGSSAGLLFTSLIAPTDPRFLALDIGNWSSRRFSASEIGYLLATAWMAYLWMKGRASSLTAALARRPTQRYLRQLAASRDYHRFIRVGSVERKDRTWEKSLLRSGLVVRRDGRRYQGIPSPKAVRWRMRRFARRLAWVRQLTHLALASGLLLVLVLQLTR